MAPHLGWKFRYFETPTAFPGRIYSLRFGKGCVLEAVTVTAEITLESFLGFALLHPT